MSLIMVITMILRMSTSLPSKAKGLGGVEEISKEGT